MKLSPATESDISHLMSWFPTGQSVDIWGGPKFRYPFTPDTFQEDVRWRDMDTYCLVDFSGEVLAFGQIYERHGRINLARLVVSPDRRGQGIGRQLVQLLMERGRTSIPGQEYSLYVYRDNHRAKACYAGLGFEENEYPEDDEMADTCIYMTRPI
jgi:ribosomal protein S18 acetylase RimI-like enzyme